MCAVAAKATVFKLDNSSGSLVDLSARINNVDCGLESNLMNSETFGDTSTEFTAGLDSGNISVSGPWDATIEAHVAAIRANQRSGTQTSFTFEYGPMGSTSGYRKFTGECLVANYSVSGGVDGLAEYTLELQCSGDVSATTWA